MTDGNEDVGAGGRKHYLLQWHQGTETHTHTVHTSGMHYSLLILYSTGLEQQSLPIEQIYTHTSDIPTHPVVPRSWVSFKRKDQSDTDWVTACDCCGFAISYCTASKLLRKILKKQISARSSAYAVGLYCMQSYILHEFCSRHIGIHDNSTGDCLFLTSTITVMGRPELNSCHRKVICGQQDKG